MKKLFIFLLFLLYINTIYADSLAGMHYLIREPKVKTTNNPVLILLHGVGSNEQDLFSLSDQLPGHFRVIALRSPVTLGENSYGFYHIDLSTGKPAFDPQEEEKSRKLLIDFIAAVKKKFCTSKSKLLLLGFSQGAIMSYNVIFTRPELVNGIAAMSGRMMDGIKPNVSKKALEAVQVFIAHGTQDQVIGIEHARTSLKYFNSIGMKPEYHEYQMAHTISPQTLSDVITWLKKTAP